ncbi:MAG: 7-cyano-7-deazaguanine synthase [Nanoarchaeota archaeon]|nr:7-cyano-7-deazaguanine synthase [Nanoarchaeota archaeon]
MRSKKALSLISSGIDSPVATWMAQRKGLDVIGIHFSNEPLSYTSPREKTVEICRHLGIRRLYIVKHGFLVQAELLRKCEDKARCVLCRRMMFRVAERIAENEGCSWLVTGENLGQVASQTLDNLTVADSAVRIPILRPVLCNDKQETVDLAKKIGTYDISIEAASCCNAVPRMPLTKAVLSRIEGEERKIEVDRIVQAAVSTAEVMDL